MGQKVHPIGFRLGINRTWDSRWFSRKTYPKLVHEDLEIRRYLKSHLSHAGISRIEIERAAERAKVNIYTSRPAIIIGKKGTEVDRIKKEVQSLTSRSDKEIFINIKEVRNAEVDAQLVAENIALQLERRIAFRRVMKKAISSALRFGAKGIKIACAGRLAGAEMARREWYLEGRVPLHTMRAQIDYGVTEAKTTYGMIGIKVWLYKGDSKQLVMEDTAGEDIRKPARRKRTDQKPGADSRHPEKRIRRRRRARKIDSEKETGEATAQTNAEKEISAPAVEPQEASEKVVDAAAPEKKADTTTENQQNKNVDTADGTAPASNDENDSLKNQD